MNPDDYMRLAIAMAENVRKYPFGAVIVRRTTGEVLAQGFNRSLLNPTFHGEIDVINRCAADRAPLYWAELDLYTTAEPCPMCQSAIEWTGISTVYFGTSIPFLQQLGWRQIDIRAEEVSRRTPFRNTKVIGGILEAECNALFKAAQHGAFNQ
jgi:tRNA(adenine34) deaminase